MHAQVARAARSVERTLARALKLRVMPHLRSTSLSHLPLALVLYADGGVGNGFVVGNQQYSFAAAHIKLLAAQLRTPDADTLPSNINNIYERGPSRTSTRTRKTL